MEAKRLLGVPADTTACVFNVDGVLVASAAVHAEAWRDAFDELIAGRIEHTGLALAEGLRRKPEPDMLLAACRHLDVDPEHAVVFETTPDGVAAGRAAGFELVVAVDRDGRARALQEEGADLVVADLGELLERQLGG